MAVFLDSLPPEITPQIFNLLDQNSVLNLVKSSRFFHQIALPHLYRHVEFRCYVYNGDREGLVQDFIFPHIYDFTLRLLDDDVLAGAVRSLSIMKDTVFRQNGGEVDPAIVSQRDLAKPLTHVKKSVQRGIGTICRAIPKGMQDRRDNQSIWLKKIRFSRDSEATLAALLPRLKNLEHLDIALGYGITRFCDLIFNSAANPASDLSHSAFQNLKCVCVHNVIGHLTYDDIAPFFELPALLRFKVKMYQHDMIPTTIVVLRPKHDAIDKCKGDGSSSVTSVSFSPMFMSYGCIGYPVITCRHLVTYKIVLRLHAIFRWRGSNYSEEIDSGLLPASSSLERLTLYYSPPLRTYHDYEDREPLKCLTSFPKLRTLRIGMAFVFGIRDGLLGDVEGQSIRHPYSPFQDLSADSLVTFLPSNIENLDLVRYYNENLASLFTNIDVLMEAVRDGKFSLLRLVTIESRMYDIDDNGEFPVLNTAYIRAGISEKVVELGLQARLLGITFKWRDVFNSKTDEEAA